MVDNALTTMQRQVLDRIGGEAVFIVFASNGVASDAYFVSKAPVRGFEKLVRGKNPVFVVNAVMRICGICHAAHGIASTEAFEDAMGISPPRNGRLLREAIGLINRIQSHLLHLTLLLPDIYPRDELLGFTVKTIKLYNKATELLGILGGAPTHPPYLVIGGVAKTPSDKVIVKITDELEKFNEEFVALREDVERKALESPRIKPLLEKEYYPEMLATHLFYGDRFNINPSKIRVVRYEEYRGGNLPKEAEENTSMIALYEDRIVEVGPRARLSIYKGFDGKTLWDLQLARFMEVEIDVLQINRLLERIDPHDESSTKLLTYRPGKGLGVYEAPRGILIHRVELDDNGRVSDYKIIVPTMFNIPHMEIGVKGLPSSIADLVPRIYDPCIPCATHVVEVDKNE